MYLCKFLSVKNLKLQVKLLSKNISEKLYRNNI
jgi:hypothetical protein